MGFTGMDDMLMEKLENKNGDMNAVLDELVTE